LRFDYTDALLLGLWNGAPPPRILDACRKLRERGLVRYLAVSTHNRPLIARLAPDPQFDIFHVRYNAVHRGAEREVFPQLLIENPPGLVSFTATSWRQLLDHKRIPSGEKSPMPRNSNRRWRLCGGVRWRRMNWLGCGGWGMRFMGRFARGRRPERPPQAESLPH
jgi:aryl-alcohol dehydrogenase-like predicted oxidoreductase